MIEEPRLCDMHQLQDGTYNIFDLYMFHELLDLREHIAESAK